MSVVQNPIVGRSSGKFSNAIFAKWKDKNTLRSKPLVVVQPNTDSQMVQRSKFGAMVRYARMILSILRYSLRAASVSMSEFNMFIKLNIGLIDSSTFKFIPALIADFRFALGSLTPLTDLVFTSASPTTIVLNWDGTPAPPDYFTNMISNVVIYKATKDVLILSENNGAYEAGVATITTASTVGDVLHAFICVSNDVTSHFSPSQYVGTRVVA